ncbi:MAG: hypothetical protein M3123_05845 [Actinomycetota bacterium]|nr:hypothetical protein [Actinomycetota bacterium]
MALPALRLLWLARMGWKRIPREKRRQIVQTARTRGPVVAKRVGTVIRDARKPK